MSRKLSLSCIMVLASLLIAGCLGNINDPGDNGNTLWTTYNGDYVSIEYPESWQEITEDAQDSGFVNRQLEEMAFFAPDDTSDAIIGIYAYVDDQVVTEREFADIQAGLEALEANDSNYTLIENVTINDHPTIGLVKTDNETNQKEVWYFLYKDNTIIWLTYYSSIDTYNLISELFNKMRDSVIIE